MNILFRVVNRNSLEEITQVSVKWFWISTRIFRRILEEDEITNME